MRKQILCLLIGGILISPFASREVRAMDPVTIAILTLVAVKAVISLSFDNMMGLPFDY